MKKLLWWLIAGTRGGTNRAKIIGKLSDRPYNAHQLAKILKLDYKTVRHHIKVLEENNIIISAEEKKYGAMYFLSNQMLENFDMFEDIWKKLNIKD